MQPDERVVVRMGGDGPVLLFHVGGFRVAHQPVRGLGVGHPAVHQRGVRGGVQRADRERAERVGGAFVGTAHTANSWKAMDFSTG
ncbi:hypothetical protein SCALM49S_03628 [Streptomyces californicus]